jgi:hypothetical protein
VNLSLGNEKRELKKDVHIMKDKTQVPCGLSEIEHSHREEGQLVKLEA